MNIAMLLHKRLPLRAAAMATAGVLITACAASPPAPALGLSATFTGGGGEVVSPTADWWQVFNDPVLDHMITRGLAGNHDARLAITRVQMARAGVTAGQSRLLPSLALTGSRSDSRSGLPPPYKNGEPDTRATRIGAELSWELDLFGAARAARRAARHDLLAAEAGIEGVRLLVSGEIARQYFTLRAARERLQLLDDILVTLRGTEALTRKREAAGLASLLDVELATGERLAAEALQPQLSTLVTATRARLAVLLGQNPGEPLAELDSAPPRAPWPDPGAPATGQPADLLARRPDLRAAEQQLAAESERLREARAQYLPKFFLSAVFGSQELTLNSVALSPVRYSLVAAAFSAPLFTGGRIRAGVQAQGAREQQALLHYERQILTAVEEVEVSLAAVNDERRRVSLLAGAVAARQQALGRGDSLYRAGQIDLLQLQILQRAAMAADQALVESEAQRALNTIRLHQALGGSWQSAPASAATPPLARPAPTSKTSSQSLMSTPS
ncbi:MAG: efflux transporter outer membrane subunit [Pseudomonadota bacterium]